ncbi:uncharacterized protein TRIADDRAFT_25084 [Trichoplax adhaerens]|uniref:Lipase domain-containing protein n=1 Tax=Trichoplax adhaerens TaxID=10228 RepID=B3RX41_TRIAD|nr:hypothetical protein TRIADDRAFT_25084 [Trichoplax adhaerens]EDV24806.1 hypothetical protein TRIADDRAFT_25084 [Trichoplax adhaerens]|eukprot:XP_002112696.1 hypothetical protein TRIADDRAFT_25084 [Trichoplax adhaerens]
MLLLTLVSHINGEISPNDAILSEHFQTWLDSRGYKDENFARDKGFSFGGCTSDSDKFHQIPIIFVHGNSDRAVGNATGQRGWTNSINYFLSKGYSPCELYAITWGPADTLLFSQQYHSWPYLLRVRKFIEAVKAYTNYPQVNIIAHSMGVTLARKAIKGGTGYDEDHGGYYDLGNPLPYVDTFIGIAGANLGIFSCFLSGPITPFCSELNGFYPGYKDEGLGPYSMSEFLTQLNSDPFREAEYIFTIWSKVDEVIGTGCRVYKKVTSRCIGQNDEKFYSTEPYGHIGVKDLTSSVQFDIITNHQINAGVQDQFL